MSGIDKKIDYGIFIMPNSVDFKGAIAWADHPGCFSYIKSMAASLAVIQVHEMGKFLFQTLEFVLNQQSMKKISYQKTFANNRP